MQIVASSPVTAKRALLQLLSATGAVEVSAAMLVEAGALLGFSENNVRVTIARLLAAGTVELTGRGSYRLGERAQALGAQVRHWSDLEKQVRRWDGGWACVYVADLPRSDRSALARRERALRLLGFKPLSRGLEIRPDNLEGSIDGLRARLGALGAGDELMVFRGSSFDDITEKKARSLWDGKKLTASYRQTTERIARWLVHAETLSPELAAREAFHFGGDILRQILFDPRLPEPLASVTDRRLMLDAAKRIDTYGRRLWHRLVGVRHGIMADPEKDHEYLAVH